MPTHFCLSVTLLNGAFHGRRDDGVPEWPPSPLRALQALVAASAARWRERQFNAYAAPALEWLAALDPPEILAPAALTTPPERTCRLYVPNNSSDLVAKDWADGKVGKGQRLVAKDLRPTRLAGDVVTGGTTVRFVWPLPADPSNHSGEYVAALSAAAGGITHLGWGVDMAAGHAAAVDESDVTRMITEHRLERWSPDSTGTPLRTPQAADGGPGTLLALVERHEEFAGRMAGGKPRDVPPLTAYRVVNYRRPGDVAPPSFLAFELRTLDDERFARFSAPRHARNVAAMLRNAVGRAAQAAGWDGREIATRVHGHAPDGPGQARGDGADIRLAYVPLPSVENRRGHGDFVSDVLRVLVTAHPSLSGELAGLNPYLSGQELRRLRSGANDRDDSQDDGKPVALLKPIPQWDAGVKKYTRRAQVWSTVTPVVLPGHPDQKNFSDRLRVTRDPDEQKRLLSRLADRTEGLLRKAIRQSGFPPELAESAMLEWRDIGFRRGVDLARGYLSPKESKTPRLHVRIHWPAAVNGPVTLGSGRYRGLGVFLADPDPQSGPIDPAS